MINWASSGDHFPSKCSFDDASAPIVTTKFIMTAQHYTLCLTNCEKKRSNDCWNRTIFLIDTTTNSLAILTYCPTIQR